jgi:hypothetical protein
MKNTNIMTVAIGVMLGSLCLSNPASAQQTNQSWQFKDQNRASIAALMKQVDQQNETSNAVAQVPVGLDTLICGGDGQSSATGNSTCIILNNSTGAIEIGQDANGSQTANNETAQSTNTEDELGDTLSSLVQ